MYFMPQIQAAPGAAVITSQPVVFVRVPKCVHQTFKFGFVAEIFMLQLRQVFLQVWIFSRQLCHTFIFGFHSCLSLMPNKSPEPMRGGAFSSAFAVG